jgi:plastocyanin
MQSRQIASGLLRPAVFLAFAGAVILFGPADVPVAKDYQHDRLHEEHGGGAPMTDEAMARWVREFYETHPIVRPASAAGPTPVATFRVLSSDFDLDSNPSGTPVDTAFIMVGETVRWQRFIGIHTLTNGESSVDPNAGSIFDLPLDAANPVYDHTFQQAGTFPFFCRPHEELNMRGVVVVEAPVGVTPLTGLPGTIGFTSELAPNPTLSGTSFRFAMREAGRARALVIDASGRGVAVVLDQELAPGTYGATWDGLARSGRRASPGVYFVHLDLPGYRSAKRVVIAR